MSQLSCLVILEYYSLVSSVAFEPAPCIEDSARSTPLIAQLVERWTVDAEELSQLISIGRWFNSGSKEYLYALWSDGSHNKNSFTRTT